MSDIHLERLIEDSGKMKEKEKGRGMKRKMISKLKLKINSIHESLIKRQEIMANYPTQTA